jgi:hypothetical protein
VPASSPHVEACTYTSRPANGKTPPNPYRGAAQDGPYVSFTRMTPVPPSWKKSFFGNGGTLVGVGTCPARHGAALQVGIVVPVGMRHGSARSLFDAACAAY